MQPSKEQQDIYDFVSTREDNLIIEAGAGSGKTTVLINSLPLIDRSKKVLLCAFNKAIADELSTRTPPHVETRTTHSQAKRYCDVAGCPTEPQKLHKALNYLVETQFSGLKFVLYDNYREVTALVGLAKAYLIPPRDKNAFSQLIRDLGLRLELGVEELAYASFNMTVLDKNIADFDDMLYFAVTENWTRPEYDVVFVDEAQDLNKAQHKFISQILKPDGRLIAVGDSRQSIYRFRGTQPNSMEILSEEFKCVSLPLMTTWRCDQSIVALANEIAGGLKARDDSSEGSVEFISSNVMYDKLQDDDFVIARTNALLVEFAMEMIKSKIKFRITNKDNIKSAIKKLEKWISRKGNIDTKELQLLCKKAKQNHLGENDDIAIIKTLSTHYSNAQQILESLKEISGIRHRKGPMLMTIHGAKGMESERVFLCTDNIPHEKTLPNDVLSYQQEKNMAYVGVTRAKTKIYLINHEKPSNLQCLNDDKFMDMFREGSLKTKPFGKAKEGHEEKSPLDSITMDLSEIP
jgi:DNA helicase-2/ATP-dependent DNA helicase PcrA